MSTFWQRLIMDGPIYVRIRPDRLSVRDVQQRTAIELPPLIAIEQGKDARILGIGEAARVLATGDHPLLVNPFDHPRSLLADFNLAEKLLQHCIRQLAGNRLLRPSPRVIIHPLEKIEGGMTSVEVRAFQELAAGAGARSVALWTGPELSDVEITSRRYPGKHWLPEKPDWA